MRQKTRPVKVGKKRFELTEKEADVVTVLRRTKKWIGPTEIGVSCGLDSGLASAWAAPTLKRLLERGVVEKSPTERGKYKLVR